MPIADTISQTEDVAERQKNAGAEQIEDVAKAVHSAADELGKQMPQAGDLVHAAASRLEQGADAVRKRDIGDLIGTFNDIGRKEPLALLGGAIVAGFAVSRFLKSSSSSARRGE